VAAAGRQSLPALAHLRCGDTYVQFAAGSGIGVATVYRYVREAVKRSPLSHRAWPRRWRLHGRRPS
jgi:hypothetical protein